MSQQEQRSTNDKFDHSLTSRRSDGGKKEWYKNNFIAPTWKSHDGYFALGVRFNVEQGKGNVDREEHADNEDLHDVLANVDMVDDATALQTDADLIPLSPPGDGLCARFRICHVLAKI